MAKLRLTDGERWVLGISVFAGALLTVIGVRFLLVPTSAAFTFGVSAPPAGHELHYVIGLRDVWLGLLAIAFAALRQWRALALWFGLGAPVCFADAAIVAGSMGWQPQFAFHLGSGVVCLALTLFTLRMDRRET